MVNERLHRLARTPESGHDTQTLCVDFDQIAVPQFGTHPWCVFLTSNVLHLGSGFRQL